MKIVKAFTDQCFLKNLGEKALKKLEPAAKKNRRGGAKIRGRAYIRDNTVYGVDQKKVNLFLDQLERCGSLHGVQHVSKNTSIVILDITKF